MQRLVNINRQAVGIALAVAIEVLRACAGRSKRVAISALTRARPR